VPSPTRCLTAGDAISFVRDRAVRRPSGPPLVGFELEWLTHPSDHPDRRVTPADLQAALQGVHLPCGGSTSIEPGGQIELSSVAVPSLSDALDAAITDAAVLRGALASAGIVTGDDALDTVRAPERVVSAPRYVAMEAYFDSFGAHGRTMMCNTASIQVNVDPGGEPCTAWRAASAAAAVLPALFGHPLIEPNRQSIWAGIDPTRTAPVGGNDPGEAWARYALAARVMFVRTGADVCTPVLDGMTFASWIADGHQSGWPTIDDLAEHLTTLFPPVRPRGFLELRTIDAMPDDRWPLAAAVAAAIVLDDRAACEVADAGGSLDAEALLSAARPALARLGLERALCP
jgi:glutamate--cysteine ligase